MADADLDSKETGPQFSKWKIALVLILVVPVVAGIFFATWAIGVWAPAPYCYLCGIPIYLFCIFGIGESVFEATVLALLVTFFIHVLVPAANTAREKAIEAQQKNQQSSVHLRGEGNPAGTGATSIASVHEPLSGGEAKRDDCDPSPFLHGPTQGFHKEAVPVALHD